MAGKIAQSTKADGQRHAQSVPRIGKNIAFTERGSIKGALSRRLNNKRSQFGIIPTLTSEIKAAYRAEQTKNLRRGRNKDAYRFQNDQTSGVEKSPTAMKLKNTFILQNNNPSFDNYANMMKKRKASTDG